MLINVITCGDHIPIGCDTSTYDGSLTPEAIEKIKEIKTPPSDKIFIGLSIRHLETAKILLGNTPFISNQNIMIAGEVGFDPWIFDAIYKEKTSEIVKKFFEFLEERKKEGLKNISIITSRIYPLILGYHAFGGMERYGPFNSKFIKMYLPCIEKGNISKFKI